MTEDEDGTAAIGEGLSVKAWSAILKDLTVAQMPIVLMEEHFFCVVWTLDPSIHDFESMRVFASSRMCFNIKRSKKAKGKVLCKMIVFRGIII